MSAAGTLMVVGTIYKIGSGFAAKKRSKKEKKRNAQQLALQAEENTKWALYNENRLRSVQSYNRGQMIVDLLNSGVSIDPGSTADIILEQQVINDEMDAMAIRSQGVADAQTLINQGAAEIRTGRQERRQITGQQVGDTISAVGQIVELSG